MDVMTSMISILIDCAKVLVNDSDYRCVCTLDSKDIITITDVCDVSWDMRGKVLTITYGEMESFDLSIDEESISQMIIDANVGFVVIDIYYNNGYKITLDFPMSQYQQAEN